MFGYLGVAVQFLKEDCISVAMLLMTSVLKLHIVEVKTYNLSPFINKAMDIQKC